MRALLPFKLVERSAMYASKASPSAGAVGLSARGCMPPTSPSGSCAPDPIEKRPGSGSGSFGAVSSSENADAMVSPVSFGCGAGGRGPPADPASPEEGANFVSDGGQGIEQLPAAAFGAASAVPAVPAVLAVPPVPATFAVPAVPDTLVGDSAGSLPSGLVALSLGGAVAALPFACDPV
jgi:hypothetical protein